MDPTYPTAQSGQNVDAVTTLPYEPAMSPFTDWDTIHVEEMGLKQLKIKLFIVRSNAEIETTENKII